jgi:hypothetical protein
MNSVLFEVSPYNRAIACFRWRADGCGGCGLSIAGAEGGECGIDGDAAVGMRQQNSGKL